MIIWMFNHYAITPDYPGGTRHFELGKNLAAGGHKVVIFASNFIHMNFTELPVGVRTGCMVENHGDLDFIWVETRQYRENNWRRLGNMMDYRRMARKTALRMIKEKELEKPDVIIGSTVHPFAPLMAA
ncbi:MAG: glycosyltransferase family 4 protein [bacterium]|nr:glycosyltransferase family 4 protein [bacterium]